MAHRPHQLFGGGTLLLGEVGVAAQHHGAHPQHSGVVGHDAQHPQEVGPSELLQLLAGDAGGNGHQRLALQGGARLLQHGGHHVGLHRQQNQVAAAAQLAQAGRYVESGLLRPGAGPGLNLTHGDLINGEHLRLYNGVQNSGGHVAIADHA